jgi:MFS family permease
MPNLSKNILLLGLVSLIADISSEMIMPIFPLFLVSIGATGLIVGLIGGLGDSLASGLNIVAGWLSDKIGKRKPIVFLGYSLSAVTKVFYPLAQTWAHLLVARPLERVGKGIRDSPRDALIAQSGIARGRSFGIHRAMDTTGAIIGTILVFLLILTGWDFRSILAVAAVIAFFALIPLVPVKDIKTKPVKVGLRFGIKGLPKKLKFFILIASIFGLANFTYMFLILRASTVFWPGFEIAGPVGLYLVFNIIYMVFAIPMGILADRIGKKIPIIFGYILFGFAYLGFLFSNSIPALLTLFILYGLGYAFIVGNQIAFVTELAPQLKGTALGSFHTANAIASLIGSIIAGMLWQISANLTFIFGTVFAFLAAAGLLFL